MRITVTRTQDQITPDLNRALKEVEKVPEGAYKIFRSHTPIRSGNARSKTRLEGTEIQANYAYATRLDNGWSNQAPDGMTKPTEAWLKRTLDKIFKGR
jgi:hypothetical protein